MAADPYRVWCPRPGCETIVALNSPQLGVPSGPTASHDPTGIIPGPISPSDSGPVASRPMRTRRVGTTVNVFSLQQLELTNDSDSSNNCDSSEVSRIESLNGVILAPERKDASLPCGALTSVNSTSSLLSASAMCSEPVESSTSEALAVGSQSLYCNCSEAPCPVSQSSSRDCPVTSGPVSKSASSNSDATAFDTQQGKPSARKLTLNLKSHSEALNDIRKHSSSSRCHSRKTSNNINDSANNDKTCTISDDLINVITSEALSPCANTSESRKTSLDEVNMIRFIGGRKPSPSTSLALMDVELASAITALQSPANYRPFPGLPDQTDMDIARLNSVQSPAEYRPLLGIPEHSQPIVHEVRESNNSFTSATCPTCHLVFCPLCSQPVHPERTCAPMFAHEDHRGIKQQYKKLVSEPFSK